MVRKNARAAFFQGLNEIAAGAAGKRLICAE